MFQVPSLAEADSGGSRQTSGPRQQRGAVSSGSRGCVVPAIDIISSTVGQAGITKESTRKDQISMSYVICVSG